MRPLPLGTPAREGDVQRSPRAPPPPPPPSSQCDAADQEEPKRQRRSGPEGVAAERAA